MRAAVAASHALVWRFRRPHHFCRELVMRTSEPKPQLDQYVASVLRFRSSQTRVPHNDANFGIGTLGDRESIDLGPQGLDIRDRDLPAGKICDAIDFEAADDT